MLREYNGNMDDKIITSHYTAYKGRSVRDGARVKVYFNLHNHKYSAVAMNGQYKGLVVGHFDNVVLSGVTFVVSEAGRKRVLEERKKNVHAYAIGRLHAHAQGESLLQKKQCSYDPLQQIKYNPYKLSKFHARCVDDPQGEYKPVDRASWVELRSNRQVHALGAE